MTVRCHEAGSDELEYAWPEIAVRLYDMKPDGVRGAFMHWHAEPEIILETHGRLHGRVTGKEITLRENDVLFINGGRLHGCHRAEEPGSVCRILSFSPALFPANAYARKKLGRLCADHRPDAILIERESDENRQLREELAVVSRAFRDREEEEVRAACERILGIIASLSDMKDEHVADPEWEIMKKMIGLIQRSYMQPLSAEEIARAGDISETHSRSMFRKMLDTTPTQYLIGFRLEKARRLLDKGVPASEAGAAAGFHTASYFAEMFHRRFSITPRQYRRTV